MNPRPIRCPSCGAAATREVTGSSLTCEFCGSTSRIDGPSVRASLYAGLASRWPWIVVFFVMIAAMVTTLGEAVWKQASRRADRPPVVEPSPADEPPAAEPARDHRLADGEIPSERARRGAVDPPDPPPTTSLPEVAAPSTQVEVEPPVAPGLDPASADPTKVPAVLMGQLLRVEVESAVRHRTSRLWIASGRERDSQNRFVVAYRWTRHAPDIERVFELGTLPAVIREGDFAVTNESVVVRTRPQTGGARLTAWTLSDGTRLWQAETGLRDGALSIRGTRLVIDDADAPEAFHLETGARTTNPEP